MNIVKKKKIWEVKWESKNKNEIKKERNEWIEVVGWGGGKIGIVKRREGGERRMTKIPWKKGNPNVEK